VQISQACGFSNEEESMNISGSKKSIAMLAKRIIGQLEKSDRTVIILVHNI
jgi:hypothetical protein